MELNWDSGTDRHHEAPHPLLHQIHVRAKNIQHKEGYPATSSAIHYSKVHGTLSRSGHLLKIGDRVQMNIPVIAEEDLDGIEVTASGKTTAIRQ